MAKRTLAAGYFCVGRVNTLMGAFIPGK